MNFEKENNSVDSMIENIKKSEEEKEFKDAVEEIENETIAKIIKGEIPINENENELEGNAKTEKLVEEIELNPEAKKRSEAKKRLKKHIVEIQDIIKGYDATSMVNPSGRIIEGESISYDDEIKLFKEKIKGDPNYNPIFTYPEIEKIDSKDIELRIEKLIDKKKDIEKENDENIKEIVFETIDVSLAEMNIIKGCKNKKDDFTFKACVELYNDIDQDLVKKSNDYYNNKTKDDSYINNPLRKKFRDIKMSSEDLKEMFKLAFGVLGINKFNIILKSDAKNISISDGKKEVIIPEKETYTLERVVELLAHEICTHAVSMINTNKAGFEGISIGKNVTDFKEGIAMLSEEKVGEYIFGDKKPIDKDWYIYAMDYRKKGNGFGATYLKMKDRILKQLLMQKIGKNEAEKKAEKESLNICRRIFRGMHDLSSNSSYCNTKDLCYFKGFIESKKMAEKGLDYYLTELRANPYLLPYFLSLKVIPEKAIITNRKVVEAVWDAKGFSRDFLENYEWYKENVQMDRHMAYRKEHGQIDEEIQNIRDKMNEKI